MKSYTDLEQSKKLAEILPLESADMSYYLWKDDGHLMAPIPYVLDGTEVKENGLFEYVYCWSLAALLSILPNNEHIETIISRGGWKINPVEYLPNTWWCKYEDTENQIEFNTSADNPVDACHKMILKLHEMNLL